MEVHLPPEIETKLVRLARQRGVDAQALARTAIESFVDYDDWFLREVEKGLAQIDRGEVLTHEAVGTRLEKRLTQKPPRP
jgi:predicted transcriptional regulator